MSSTIFLLKRLGMSAKEQSLGAFDDAGLHPYHHAILAVLDEGSRETQGAIADALGYDKGQLVGLLDELEDAGLVSRQRDQADRRRQIVQMTPAGRKMLDKLRKLSARRRGRFPRGAERQGTRAVPRAPAEAGRAPPAALPPAGPTTTGR